MGGRGGRGREGGEAAARARPRRPLVPAHASPLSRGPAAPSAYPFTFGLSADLGQTAVSAANTELGPTWVAISVCLPKLPSPFVFSNQTICDSNITLCFRF